MKQVPNIYFCFLVLISWNLLACTSQQTLKNRPTDSKFQATSFYEEFIKNEEVSKLRYQGAVLEIVGTIRSIQKTDEQHYHILLNSNHRKGHILCSCRDLSSNFLSGLTVGQIIRVKGEFAGFEKDVMLSPCIII